MAKTVRIHNFNCLNFEAWLQEKTRLAINAYYMHAASGELAKAKAYDKYANDLVEARIWMAEDGLDYTVDAVQNGYFLTAYENGTKVMELEVTRP